MSLCQRNRWCGVFDGSNRGMHLRPAIAMRLDEYEEVVAFAFACWDCGDFFWSASATVGLSVRCLAYGSDMERAELVVARASTAMSGDATAVAMPHAATASPSRH